MDCVFENIGNQPSLRKKTDYSALAYRLMYSGGSQAGTARATEAPNVRYVAAVGHFFARRSPGELGFTAGARQNNPFSLKEFSLCSHLCVGAGLSPSQLGAICLLTPQ
jgi:hypothetical protein